MRSPFLLRGNKERHLLSLSPIKDVVNPTSWDEMNRMILSIIPYTGGKAGLVPSLVPLLEWTAKQYDLKAYNEVTGGGGRCLINIDPTSFEHRVYSDADLPLCCLFQVLTNEYLTKDMIKKLHRQDYCEEVFNEAVASRNRDNDLAMEGRFNEASEIVTAAANTFVAALMSRAAGFTSYDSASARARRKGYYDRVLNLGQFVPILSGVEVFRWDCRELIKEIEREGKYKPQQCLVYVDPPYDPKAMKGKKHYRHSWKREDHIIFRDLIRHTDTFMVISGYDSDIYDELEKHGWRKILLKMKHVSSSGIGRMEAEYIYLNFEITPDLLALISTEELLT